MYFALILGNHVSAFLVAFAYYPSIVSCILSWTHLGGFMGLLINTVCVEEKEVGKGGRTITNRVLWVSSFLLI